MIESYLLSIILFNRLVILTVAVKYFLLDKTSATQQSVVIIV